MKAAGDKWVLGEGDQALMGRTIGRDRGLRQALGGAESRAENLQAVLGET